jgi:hypothetical protein
VDLKIIGNGLNARVFLDGVELRGVTGFKFEQEYRNVARLSLEMVIDTHEIVMEEENDGK